MKSIDVGDELRARLDTLRDRLHEEVARVSALRGVTQRRRELDRLLADLDRQIERAQRAAVITLVGATGAGKSTLLNALAGAAIATEGIDRPTTRQPVIYAPRDADLGDLVAGAVSPPGGHESEGAPVVVRYAAGATASGPWTAQILIDAPDLNSVDEQHRAVVAELAERSDVLLVVLHHQSVIEQASVSFLDAFAGRRRLLFVLNRADELTASARDALLEQVKRLAAERWQAPAAPVIAVSARAAQTQPRAEGWPELCHALHELVRESAISGARRLNALGTAARIESIFDAVRSAAAADLAALPDEVAAGFEELQRRCAAEVSERLDLRRADLTELLWTEAAKRWDGPGGWAVRTGGVGSLGLGAGAALASRNPLLAAGAAAGAVAVDQVQRALRERRVGDPAGLLPGATEFASWYAAALSPARVRAGRLTGEPEVFGLPGADSARANAAVAVEESWNRLLDRDLPAAAERSLLRFFRLLLDLPVYGLAGWVIYRVANGFFGGDYAGLDFLVNAVLLLAAYLFAVRFAVRRGLSRRARRLLREVIQRTRDALGHQATAVQQAVHRATADQTGALDRLASLAESWRRSLAE